MFTKRNTQKIIIVTIVAMILVATLILSACDGTKPFKPVTMPDSATVENNGGIAVKYGKWIYYVNGYQSSATADNTYVDVSAEPRVGSVVRIELSVIDDLLAISADKDISSSAKEKQIAATVREKAETVVPNIYYSANSSNTHLNGIFIFNERLYMTTPNDALTAGGNKLTDQLVLVSYKLDGSDMQKHHVFEKNSAQILLSLANSKLYATYFEDTSVGYVDIEAGTSKVVDEHASNVNFDIAGNGVFYTNEDGAICNLAVGAEEAKVFVPNEKREDQENTSITYTVKSVNNGYVYYTVKDSENPDAADEVLYYATASEHDKVALDTASLGTFLGWNDKVVYVASQTSDKTLYGLYLSTSVTGANSKVLVDPVQNDKSITFNRLVGDTLYYTVNGFSYTLNLADANAQPAVYAKDLGSASNWYAPKVINEYVFTLSSSEITVAKYDSVKRTNSSSVKITLTAEPEEK